MVYLEESYYFEKLKNLDLNGFLPDCDSNYLHLTNLFIKNAKHYATIFNPPELDFCSLYRSLERKKDDSIINFYFSSRVNNYFEEINFLLDIGKDLGTVNVDFVDVDNVVGDVRLLLMDDRAYKYTKFQSTIIDFHDKDKASEIYLQLTKNLIDL